MLYALVTLFELFRNVDVSYDRTCDKLWEKGNIGGKVKEVLLTSYFALINVDNVGKGLEAVEWDTDREGETQGLYLRAENAVCRTDEKVGIFKKQKKSDVPHHRSYHCDERSVFFCAFTLFVCQ